MTQIIVLPHVELCPDGSVLEAAPGTTLCDALLEHGIDIEHACEKSCACTTCHVIVREGFSSLNAAEDEEEDLLDKAWGLEPQSRLSCQAVVAATPLVVEHYAEMRTIITPTAPLLAFFRYAAPASMESSTATRRSSGVSRGSSNITLIGTPAAVTTPATSSRNASHRPLLSHPI